MPTPPTATTLSRQALLDELAALEAEDVARIAGRQGTHGRGLAQARASALEALASADRLGLLDAGTERIAELCLTAELPQPVRSAAYDALVALLARDLVPLATFRALYAAWDEGAQAPAAHSPSNGEELLLHLD
jgi:hypothetical protein